jgi:hypothetical protein
MFSQLQLNTFLQAVCLDYYRLHIQHPRSIGSPLHVWIDAYHHPARSGSVDVLPYRILGKVGSPDMSDIRCVIILGVQMLFGGIFGQRGRSEWNGQRSQQTQLEAVVAEERLILVVSGLRFSLRV